jgi:hypothetical protein
MAQTRRPDRPQQGTEPPTDAQTVRLSSEPPTAKRPTQPGAEPTAEPATVRRADPAAEAPTLRAPLRTPLPRRPRPAREPVSARRGPINPLLAALALGAALLAGMLLTALLFRGNRSGQTSSPSAVTQTPSTASQGRVKTHTSPDAARSMAPPPSSGSSYPEEGNAGAPRGPVQTQERDEESYADRSQGDDEGDDDDDRDRDRKQADKEREKRQDEQEREREKRQAEREREREKRKAEREREERH